MSAVDDYIKENAEIHKFAAEVARIISGIPQMPEFSNERITVEDVSKMTGIPVSSVRAGIVYGWLPVGVAIQNNKPAKSLSGGSRITYIVSPRKVYEVTGHVWRGKEALKKKIKLMNKNNLTISILRQVRLLKKYTITKNSLFYLMLPKMLNRKIYKPYIVCLWH